MSFTTPITFVDHIWQLFAPLLLHRSAVIFPDNAVLDPPRLIAELAAHRCTTLVAVPSLLRLLLPALQWCGQGTALRLLVSSGEPLPAELARRLRAALPADCTFLNIYGAGTLATARDCRPDVV